MIREYIEAALRRAHWRRAVRSGYSLGEGERQSIELCGQEDGVDGLVTDDYLAFIAATRLGMKTGILPDLVVELARGKCLTPEVAEAILKAISDTRLAKSAWSASPMKWA